MWTKRNMYIAGAAFIAMVAVFVATFDWGVDEGTGRGGVVVRPQRPSRPAAPVTPAPQPAVQQTPAPAEAETAVAAAPEPPREVTFKEAETAYNEHRYEDATELFTRYTGRKAGNPWGHYMLGLSAWKSKDYETAETAFDRAIDLDPKHVKSYVNLSRVLLDTSRPAEAMARIDSALALDPESGVAFRLRGRAFHQLGLVDDAMEAYRRAIVIDNGDAWSMNNMALLLIEQERFEEALPALARAIQLRDDVAVFHNNLGMTLENTGYFADAADAYEAALAIDGTQDKALSNYERVSAVTIDPVAEPVDLAAAADRFVEEIGAWALAAGEGGSGEVAVTSEETMVITAAGGTVDGDTPEEVGDAGDTVAEADTTDTDG